MLLAQLVLSKQLRVNSGVCEEFSGQLCEYNMLSIPSVSNAPLCKGSGHTNASDLHFISFSEPKTINR